MKRVDEVVKRIIEKFFGGKFSARVERHLTREDITAIAEAAYEVGYHDGVKDGKAVA